MIYVTMKEVRMKKMTLLLTVCLLASVLWGCGGGKPSKPRNADLETEVLPLLEESIRSMAALKGYRIRGSLEMGAGGEGAGDSGTLRMDMDSDVENTESGTNQYMRMDMNGLVTEAYIYGDYFYQNVPGKGWIKTGLAQYQAQSQNLSTGVIREEQLRLIMDSAVEATIRDGEEGTRELSLVLGKEFLLRSLQYFREEAGEEAMGRMEQWMSAMEEAAEGFTATLTLVVERESHLIKEMEMAIEMRDIPGMGTYRSRMHAEIYDYGGDIHIELPAEAKNAPLQE